MSQMNEEDQCDCVAKCHKKEQQWLADAKAAAEAEAKKIDLPLVRYPSIVPPEVYFECKMRCEEDCEVNTL